MARSRVAVLIAAFTCIAGCGPSLQHVAADNPVRTLTIQVREFDPPTPMRGVSVPQIEPSVAQRIVHALQQAGINATLATSDSPNGTAADLMLEGQVTQIERGNRGLRYLAGPFSSGGSGAARFAVKGRAVRRDGAVAGEFSARRRAGWGLFGGNSDSLLSNCVDSVAYDVAEMVVRGVYTEQPEDTAFRANTLFHP